MKDSSTKNSKELETSALPESEAEVAKKLYQLARLASQVNEFEEVIDTLLTIEKYHLKDAEFYYFLGDSYYKLSKYDEALIYINKAIQLNRDNPNFFDLLGTIFFEKKGYDKALPAFSFAIFLDNREASFYYHRGLTNIYLDKYDDAIKDFQSSIQLDNTNIDCFFILIRSEIYQKNFMKAIQACKDALKVHQHPALYFLIAIAYLWIPDYDLALLYLKNSLECDTKDPLVSSLFANIEIHLGFRQIVRNNSAKQTESNLSLTELFNRILAIYEKKKISATFPFNEVPEPAKKLVREIAELEDGLIVRLKNMDLDFAKTQAQCKQIFLKMAPCYINLGDYYFNSHKDQSKNNQASYLETARIYFSDAFIQLKKAESLGASVDQLLGLALLKKQQKLPKSKEKKEDLKKVIQYLTAAIDAGENAYAIRAQAHLENHEPDKAKIDIVRYFNYKNISFDHKLNPKIKTDFPWLDAQQRYNLYKKHAELEQGKMCQIYFGFWTSYESESESNKSTKEEEDNLSFIP